MRVTAYDNMVNISSDQEKKFSFDASGRLYGIHNDNWFIQRGLDGRMIGKQWREGRKNIHCYSSEESIRIEDEAQENTERILGNGLHDIELKLEKRKGDSPSIELRAVQKRKGDSPSIELRAVQKRKGDSPSIELRAVPDYISKDTVIHWLERICSFDYKEDKMRFNQAYGVPVGILPPDHYLPVVIQITEGCKWNQCTFCNFYKNQWYKKKSRNELSSHIEGIKSFFGEGISLRNSIFLGEANSLAYDPVSLAEIVEDLCLNMGNLMPDFRGVGAFMEPCGAIGYTTKDDFAMLSHAGMTHLYMGLETGDENLRARIRKSCSVSTVIQMINRAKQGGLSIGIIVLLGIGGREYNAIHVQKTLRVIRELNLNSSDMIFLSPLIESNTYETFSEFEPLPWEGLKEQHYSIRQGLPPGIRSSLYEIQGFIY